VAYTYVRAGVTGHVPLAGPLSLATGVGYRHMLGLGEIGDDAFFPRASAAAVDGYARVEMSFGRLSAHVGVDVERYFYALKPEPGDPLVAGGALDQFIGANIGLGYAL
jgi:hypothetical protein